MDVKEVIQTLEKFENDVCLSFKEVCAVDITIQVLEKYMKGGKNNEKLC